MSVCVYVCERERERECVCVCVCGEWVRECVSERERNEETKGGRFCFSAPAPELKFGQFAKDIGDYSAPTRQE